MKGIPQKTMLALWDELLVLERATDHELARRAGISQGSVSGWRSGRWAGLVRLSTLGQIERGLGYRCTLKPNGKWEIEKLAEEAKESDVAVYFKTNGTPSKEEIEETMRFARELANLDSADRATVEALIERLGKK